MITINFKKTAIALGAITCLLWGATTIAAPVLVGSSTDMYLKQNTFPSGLSEEKIFLDADDSPFITGHIGNQTDPRLVNFTSTTDTLSSANGFASIDSVDNLINDITITAPGYLFEDLIFSVQLLSKDSDLVITTTDQFGITDSFSNWTNQDDWTPGTNRILLLSNNGNLIQSVHIASNDGIRTSKQFEVSGVSAVPVPGAIWLFGSAIVGMALKGSRRNKLNS